MNGRYVWVGVLAANVVLNVLVMTMLSWSRSSVAHETAAPCASRENADQNLIESLSLEPDRRHVDLTLKTLSIAIPTLRRKDDTNYLGPALEQLLLQIRDSPFRRLVQVFVVNQDRKPDYPSWLSAQKLVAEMHFEDVVVFFDASQTWKARHPNIEAVNYQKQTADLVPMMKRIAGRAKYFMFMEDDFVACPGMLESIQIAILKANQVDKDWIAIFAGFGMNAILLQDRDVVPFADYLEAHAVRRPPDHLIVEWSCGETQQSSAYKGNRKHFAFRHTIFQHIGVVSSIQVSEQRGYPSCYSPLIYPTLFEVNAFNMETCNHDLITPCLPKSSVQALWKPFSKFK
jgi:hypothetical protein